MAGLSVGLFGAGIPLLLPIAGLLLLVGIVMKSSVVFTGIQSSDYLTRYSIDFNQVPPLWHSDDDTFWKGVKTFFSERLAHSPDR